VLDIRLRPSRGRRPRLILADAPVRTGGGLPGPPGCGKILFLGA